MALDQNTLKQLGQLLTDSTPAPWTKIRMEARYTDGAREIQASFKPEGEQDFKPYAAFIPFADATKLIDKLHSAGNRGDQKWNVLQMVIQSDGSFETDRLWDEDFEEDVKSYQEPSQPE